MKPVGSGYAVGEYSKILIFCLLYTRLFNKTQEYQRFFCMPHGNFLFTHRYLRHLFYIMNPFLVFRLVAVLRTVNCFTENICSGNRFTNFEKLCNNALNDADALVQSLLDIGTDSNHLLISRKRSSPPPCMCLCARLHISLCSGHSVFLPCPCPTAADCSSNRYHHHSPG